MKVVSVHSTLQWYSALYNKSPKLCCTAVIVTESPAFHTVGSIRKPANDGKVVRLQIPQVTEERRKELTKVVKKLGEDDKVAVRNLRREANDKVKKMEKAGDFTEDDAKSTLDEIQKIIDKAVKDIDAIVEAKEKEIMEV